MSLDSLFPRALATAALALTLAASSALAADAPPAPAISKAPAPAASNAIDTGTPVNDPVLKKTLETRLEATIDAITKMPVGGLYEVRVGNDVFYTDPAGNFIIVGNVIDLRTHENLTRQRRRGDQAGVAAGVQVRRPAVRHGGQGRQGQRQAQGRHLRGPELRLLQAAREVDPRCRRRDDLRLPVSGPRPRLADEVEAGLVRGRSREGLDRLDAERDGAGRRRRAARRRSTGRWSSAASCASKARRRCSSRTTSASKARSTGRTSTSC